MGVVQDVERLLARFFARSQDGFENARRLGVLPTEVVVHLSPGGERSPESAAEALCQALPLGRVVRGVDLLTGAIEVRFFYDAAVLKQVRDWLTQSQAPHEISYLY